MQPETGVSDMLAYERHRVTLEEYRRTGGVYTDARLAVDAMLPPQR